MIVQNRAITLKLVGIKGSDPEQEHGEHQSNPEASDQPDGDWLRRFSPNRMEPSVKCPDATRKHDPPQSESDEYGEAHVIRGLH